MTPEQFIQNWTETFPEIPPISHVFKDAYADHWLRIHSLPGSKRYPDSPREWATLLHRQNTIIAELLGQLPEIFLVAGDYVFEDDAEPHITETNDCLSGMAFQMLPKIEIQQSEDNDELIQFRPAFSSLSWQTDKHNDLLMGIANDELRAFYVSFENNILVAPYDGGMDIILPNSELAPLYRERYKEWLSTRDDGM